MGLVCGGQQGRAAQLVGRVEYVLLDLRVGRGGGGAGEGGGGRGGAGGRGREGGGEADECICVSRGQSSTGIMACCIKTSAEWIYPVSGQLVGRAEDVLLDLQGWTV
jgi:hypothetical protein